MSTPRTPLARKHAAVIAAAPAEMQPRLRAIAAQCCLRRYDQQEMCGSDDLSLYLDSEDFYYNRFTS